MSAQTAGSGADRDAFGHMLMDYLLGQEAVDLIERDDGYIDSSLGGAFYFAPFADWPALEQAAMPHLLPGRVLDVGCGAGRAGLHLQAQGFAVTGIDVSPLAVEVCRRRGMQDARVLSVTQAGPALGCFDNIIMLGNNWGLLGGWRRARWLLRRFHRLTAPQARIIAGTTDALRTVHPFHLAYQARNRARGRLPGQLRLRVRYQQYCGAWFEYLLSPPDEMRAILAGTGWQVRELLAGEGAGYVAVIEKTPQE
jgi:SAM-dependent methyltransferase